MPRRPLGAKTFLYQRDTDGEEPPTGSKHSLPAPISRRYEVWVTRGTGEWHMPGLKGRGRRLAAWRWSRGEWVPAGISGAGVLIGWRLLSGTFTMFQHAYLGSYWAVPGSQVPSAYWQSVRFAFGETVLVAMGVGALTCLTVFEVGRAARR